MFDLLDQKNDVFADGIKRFEELLQAYKYIGKKQTIYHFLKKPFVEIQQAFDRIFKDQVETFGLSQNDGGGHLFFHVATLMLCSESLYSIKNQKRSETITSNSEMLRDYINSIIVRELNPYIFSFIKWDFDRRAWKHIDDRMLFLNKTVIELEQELRGERNNLLKKYIGLLLDYFIFNIEKVLSTVPYETLKRFNIKPDKIHQIRNQLTEFSRKDGITSAFDDETEASILKYYKPKAQSYLEGLIKTSDHRFDYFITAFIEAQRNYMEFVKILLNSLSQRNINEINSLNEVLRKQEVGEFINILHSAFASVPNELIKNSTEAYYHIFIHLALKMSGCNIMSEVSTNKGRIDAVIEFDDFIYIIEFKTSEAIIAMNQIEKKGYYESYVSRGKKLFLLGLAFNNVEKNIKKDYSLKEIIL